MRQSGQKGGNLQRGGTAYHGVDAVDGQLLRSDLCGQLERLRHAVQQTAVGCLEFLR